MRLVVKKWTNLAALDGMNRTEVLDANDWLDALEEAEDNARRKAERQSKRGA